MSLGFETQIFAFQGDHNSQQPSITKVCRQLRCEALPLYYELNQFIISLESTRAHPSISTVDEPAIAAKWLKAIGMQDRKHLRSLVVFCRPRARLTRSCNLTLPQFLVAAGLELVKATQVRLVQTRL